MLRILSAEDERHWDANDLGALLKHHSTSVRLRAVLATGRIGDARAVSALVSLMQQDKDASVRAMAAFALGETESVEAAASLIQAARSTDAVEVRARALEALGKIAAVLPKDDETHAKSIGETILLVLDDQSKRGTKAESPVVLLGLTAALRARPADAGKSVMRFLSSPLPHVREDATNTLARLRAKDANEILRALLINDLDPVVRANAARALGGAEDKGSFDALLTRLSDKDLRVRVSAIRALGSLKDARAADPLLKYGESLLDAYHAERTKGIAHPSELNELLEIATSLGRVLANTSNETALHFLRALREAETWSDPETEIAFARIAPGQYMREPPFMNFSWRGGDHKLAWQSFSAIAQGLGELAAVSSEKTNNGAVKTQSDAQRAIRQMLVDTATPALALPDVLTALAAFKPLDLAKVMRAELSSPDVIVRATAAGQLAELPPDRETERALAAALPAAMRDVMNDGALAILDALAKQKTDTAHVAIKSALDSTDYLIRRRAVALLQAAKIEGNNNGMERIETVATRNHTADYRRALARTNKRVLAVVQTEKGAFTIELLADAAPLTVDNFVQLAGHGFFNGIAFHRVVPNFVVQGGDPRGDGNGGPGYQIRCEINEEPYGRGAVGMALSGKDTGGSQWFVTHSPQPHLDGGYTVFGRVVQGMEVVDKIARGDRILRVKMMERQRK